MDYGKYSSFREKNLKIIRQLLIVVMLVAISGCTITNKYGPYYGKVVDAETKEPIEGAAVLIVFHTVSATLGGAVYKYADAVETLTDKNGEFKIVAHRIVSPGVLRRWDEYGYVTIFKPGYGCYPLNKKAKPMFVPNGMLPQNEFVTIELPKVVTKEERIENTRCIMLSSEVPIEKYKRLLDQINQERFFLGYKPIE